LGGALLSRASLPSLVRLAIFQEEEEEEEEEEEDGEEEADHF
jgi:hypothetical protein